MPSEGKELSIAPSLTVADTSSWSNPAHAEMAGLVAAAIGLSFPEPRRPSAEAAMRLVWQRARAQSASDYLAGLLDGTIPLDELISELVNGETYFFRHREQFELLQSAILPALRARLGRGVYIWCAGCASGEEAYSLAFAAAASKVRGMQDHVLATDASFKALARARGGVYDAWSMRGVSQQLVDQVCERLPRSFVVRERWRRPVTFAYANLYEAPHLPFPLSAGSMDLIFCRNVLIYWEDAVVRRVAETLHDTLSEGGYLLTAPTDPPLWDLAPFAVEQTSAGIVYRRQGTMTARQAAGVPLLAPGPWARPVRMSSPRLSAPAARVESSAAPASIERAALALASGNWALAATLTEQLEDEHAAALHVRALSNWRGTAVAEQVCARAASQYPISVELHHLRALLLLDLGQLDAAAAAERRVLFLDPTAAMGYFVLGNIARRAGDLGQAKRSYRNACELLRNAAPGAAVPFAEGAPVAALLQAAAAECSMAEQLESA